MSGQVLVLTDRLGWALDSLYSPLGELDYVDVLPCYETAKENGMDYVNELIDSYPVTHFAYWNNYIDHAPAANAAILSIHHLVLNRFVGMMDAFRANDTKPAEPSSGLVDVT